MHTHTQRKIIKALLEERDRQDRKWGGPKHDDQHTFEEWCGFIRERVRERDDSELEMIGTSEEIRIYIETGALAIAALESLLRREVDDLLRTP
jgi:hypothetical protein